MREPILKRESLSRQIIPILREEILTHRQPGQRLEPIEQMAKHFSVSFPTMREALSVLEQEGLVERHVGRGTFVGDLNKSRHVGVLAEQDISDPRISYFYRRTPQRVVHFLRANGWPVRLYAGHLAPDDESLRPLTCTDFLEAVERRRLSGVAAFAPDHTFSPWLESLRKQGVPVVGLNPVCEHRVRVDHAELGRKGGEYLLRQGRRRIALLDYDSPLGGRLPHTEGFQAAMAAAGLELNPDWTRHDSHPCAPGAGWEEFRAIWINGRTKPNGLLICDDNLFPGAAMAILQLGIRVPEDLLVVTHWNKGSPMAVPFPVTKLQFAPDHHARVMGEMLIKLVRREPVANHHVVLSCELLEPEAAEPQVYSRRLAGGHEVNVALDGGRSAP